jgi:eukaryotic-like serine/threonine-protein kinase
MRSPRLIGPRETPSAPGTTPAPPRGMPRDLLRQASRRLEIMALIGAALWILGPLFGHLALHFTNPGDEWATKLQVLDAIAFGAFLTSVALFIYLRRTRREPQFVLDLGLAYMVFVAIDLGVMIHWGPMPAVRTDLEPMISWIGPVILMFAAIVPAAPWKMFVAGLLAASMDPIGMWIARAGGRYEFDSWIDALAMHYPNYLLLGVAVVISGVVTRLGQQVTRERELGSYRMGDLLGRGGMGEVYQATHRMLARPAAIKLIRSEVLDSGDGTQGQTATVRFRREAEAAAKLRSPHTVELYDFGVTEEGRLYLVMELLEGTTLEALVRRHGPLPAPRVIHILRQVCDSLEEAHAAGLVHRDIKPANIHLGRVGLHHDFVKVLDFGLVKSVAGAGGEESLASATGITPGTPAYMAPEMAHPGSVDGRADLYSLGCVAYYLLTGRLVFEAETAIQMILQHLQHPPAPPSARTATPVPPGLESVVLACLAKRPADRPRSAAELRRTLEGIGGEQWSEEEAERWWSDPSHAA